MLCSQRALVKTNRSNDWPSLKPIIKSSFGPRDEGHTRARLQHPKDGVDLIGAIFRPFTAALKQTNRSLEKISIFSNENEGGEWGACDVSRCTFPCLLLLFPFIFSGAAHWTTVVAHFVFLFGSQWRQAKLQQMALMARMMSFGGPSETID